MEWIQSVGATWGIGAVFAVILFIILMRVMKHYTDQMREDRKFMEDRLSEVIDAYNKSVRESTKVLSELFTWLKAKNGSK